MAQVQSSAAVYNDNSIAHSAKFLDSMKQEPKFSWDWTVPDTNFWQNLTPHDAQSIQSILPGKEAEQLGIDASLPREQKLNSILQEVQTRYEARERAAAPRIFPEVDYDTWSKYAGTLSHLHMALKRYTEAEHFIMAKITIQDPAAPKEGQSFGIGGLPILRMAQGRFEEAEAFSRKGLDRILELPQCGPESPMALGSRRGILEALWKQGKTDEAEALFQETAEVIEKSRETKFSKYADEESDSLQKLWKELQTWKQ